MAATAATFSVAVLVALTFRLPPALMVAPLATVLDTVPEMLPTTTDAPNGANPASALAMTGSSASSDAVALMVTAPEPVMLAWPLIATFAVELAAT